MYLSIPLIRACFIRSVNRSVSPGKVFAALLLSGPLDRLGKLQQSIGRIGATIQKHVFDMFQQFRGNLLVDFQLSRVDDSHVQACFDGVEQKGTVHRFANAIIATKAEADIADAAAGLCAGAFLLDATDRVDEIDCVVVVFFDPGCHGQDVRIKDDVLGRKVGFVNEQVVGTLADSNLVLFVGGLALLVKGHHHGGGAVLADQSGASQEFLPRHLSAKSS